MPNIPYPEFNDFHLELNRKIVRGTEPVEGYALLSMNANPNCVKDILIALRCCFRYRTDDGTTHTVLLHEEIQRNATPFDDSGVPEGDYEFPFSFTIPPQLPPSVVITGGWDTLNNCKIWYEIRAYVMHAENHATLERKHLRTSVKFQRCVTYSPQSELMPQVAQKKEFSFSHVDVRVELDKDVYLHSEPIRVNMTVRNELLRSVSAIKIFCKQVITIRKRSMRQVKEFIIKHNVGTAEARGNGIPIKRHQTYTGQVVVVPQYTQEEAGQTYGGIALSGRLDQPDNNTQLSPSITRHTPEGVDVSYSVEIHLCVMLASDMIINIPFTLSDTPPEDSQGLPPSYWNQAQITEPIVPVVEPPHAEPEETEETGISAGELPSYDEAVRRSSVYKPVEETGETSTDTPTHTDEGPSESPAAAVPSSPPQPPTVQGDTAPNPPTIVPPSTGNLASGEVGAACADLSQSVDQFGNRTGQRRTIRMSMNRQTGGGGTDQLNHASLNMDKLNRPAIQDTQPDQSGSQDNSGSDGGEEPPRSRGC
eukprot:comp12569_c0_seq1/m.7571 comp12569_c0_seq1/g.7571  ORF comp12569_c0_seq1/g.7571 comp12569_c0_seq1/m.7571 type:complete len:536 (-) comp12569_c0_seq1:228-1835(-)